MMKMFLSLNILLRQDIFLRISFVKPIFAINGGNSFLKYRKSIKYLYNRLPIFQKIGQMAYKEDLSRTKALMKLHNNPEKKFKSVLVAGTNGKGSISTMLSEIFRKNGYKTGLYTSPHFKDFRERIRINGKKISKSYVKSFVSEHKENWKSIEPSFFEVSVAMAFSYFAHEEVDIAIVEVGMGGRLDSTNVLQSDLGIISRIDLDHQQFLGDTIAEIAREKAGIIKERQEVVIGQNQEEAIDSIKEIAKQKNANLNFAERYKGDLDSTIPEYQRENIGTVIQACMMLKKNGWTLDTKRFDKQISKTLLGNKLKGRWQQIGSNPLIIADAAHNKNGLKALNLQLSKTNFNRLHIVYGTVKDKDYEESLKNLPKNAMYYFCKADIPRGLETKMLVQSASKIGLQGEAFDKVKIAFLAAKQQAKKDDLILVTGSIFVIAEVL